MAMAEAMSPKAPAKAKNDVSAGGLPKTCCLASVTERARTMAPKTTFEVMC